MHGCRSQASARDLLRAPGSTFIWWGIDMGWEMTNARSPKSRDGVDQDQFLTILSREEAIARFEAALFPRAIPHEQRPLSDALGGVLAADIAAPIDVPPFDRSNVDGLAGRSADLASAHGAAAVRVLLYDDAISS